MNIIRSCSFNLVSLCLLLAVSAVQAEELYSIDGSVSLLGVDGAPKEDRSNVVVFVDSETLVANPAPPPTAHWSMSQKNMLFSPLVLPILVGGTVDFPNEDVIFHNVFSRTKIAPFDLGHYKRGPGKSVQFLEPGLVKVYCNIHSKMVGYILVLPNAHFSTTSKEGDFHLAGVPKGRYEVTAWQRFGDAVKSEVVVGSGAKVVLTLRETGTEQRHKNKWGRDFDDKY